MLVESNVEDNCGLRLHFLQLCPKNLWGRCDLPRRLEVMNTTLQKVASFLTRTKIKKNGFFLKDALWGGGGYPPELAWWTGRLTKGLDSRKRGQGRVGLAGKRLGGYLAELAWWTGGQGGGARARGGGASAQGRSKFRNVCHIFVTCKKKKNGPVGWGGVPTGAGLVDVREAGQGLGGGARAGEVGKGLGGCKGFGSGGLSGRGTGPRDGANFATCVVFFSRTKRRKMAFCEGSVGWGTGGQGGGARARGGGARASVPEVGGRDTGPMMEQRPKKEEKWLFLKDALWGGGGVPTRAGLVNGG